MKPTIDILGDFRQRYLIDTLKVSQEEGAHDLLTAFVTNPGKPNIEDLKGAPCRVIWGAGPSATTNVGYVDTVSRVSGDEGLSGWVFMVLGATSVMRSGEPRTWRRTTPFRIARTITRNYRMSLVTDQYITPLDHFMQSDESDWAALTRLGEKTGMALVGSNTHVRLIDVRRALGRAARRSVPTFRDPDSFVRMETPSPVGFDTYEFSGIDALGQTFAVRGGPPGGVKRHSGMNFGSLEQARNASIQWEDRQRERIRALAQYGGRLPVKCGDVIFAEGYLWFVSKCEHEVSQLGKLTETKLELHRTDVARPSSLTVVIPPSPRLLKGRWAASRSKEVEV